MRATEEKKKPMATSSEVLSWHLRIHPPPETSITRIDGYYDKSGIRYLELSTNNGKMCSFGRKASSPFVYQDSRGFTNFHGCSNSVWLTALGVYVNSSANKS